MSRHEKQPGERESVELPVEPLDQREAAFIKLLAEAIASDIRRGGALKHEPPDELDEEPAAVSSAVTDVLKAEEAGDEQ
jgi:hypothetical protein